MLNSWKVACGYNTQDRVQASNRDNKVPAVVDMDPEELSSCWKGHLALPFAASRDPEMEEEVLKNYTLALMNNKQEEVARTFYTILEVADKLMEGNREDNTSPDDDGNADENSVEAFGNVKIAEAGDNNFPGNNYPDTVDNPLRTPCDDRS